MPTYEYRCTRCENTFEVRQSFSEDPLTECPLDTDDGGTCGGEVKTVFGNVGIAFKGSGFYKTDSRSGSSSGSTTSSSTTTSSDTGSSSSSSDSSSSSTSSSTSTSTSSSTD